LMFGVVSSSPITSSISNGHLSSVELQESITPSADSPFLTWTSRTQNESLPISNGSSLVGDHVVVNATFPANENITKCNLHIWDGLIINTTRPLVYNPDAQMIDEFINPDMFDWITIEGLQIGDLVSIICNFTSTECDFFAWDGLLELSQNSFSNPQFALTSSGKPKSGNFTWTSSNDVMHFACLNFENTTIGNWTCYIEIGNHVKQVTSGSSIEIDTYYFDSANQTYDIQVTGYTDTNSTYVISREDIQICNFFAPKVIVPSPVTLVIDERTYNITWSSTDVNADDVTYYSVWLSNNDGVSYMLLVQNLTSTWYLWNSTGWLEDSYMYRVRAYSVDLAHPQTDVSDPPAGYWPGDYSDGFAPVFDGYGPPPADTDEVTETTEPVPDSIGDPDILLVGFVIGISFGASVIVLIAFIQFVRKRGEQK